MNHQQRAARRSEFSRPVTACEPLEERRLLAASAMLGADGVIVVEGTPRNDDIAITQHLGKGDRLRVDVTRNGTPLGTFLRSQVKGVRAFGGLGDDAIHVDGLASGFLTAASVRTSPGGGDVVVDGQLWTVNGGTGGQASVYIGPMTAPVTLFGGGGNDTLTGGAGNDRLEGGSGNDLLWGESGDDQLFGQNDDDSLRGGDGTDTLNGQDGDDDLDGDAATPRFILFTSGGQSGVSGTLTPVGDAGSGTWTVSGGSAVGAGSPSAHDVLTGGDGADRFHRSDKLSEFKDRTDDDRVV